jgi:hypothetical protein
MKLHSRNMAVSAGAVGEEIEIVATKLQSHIGPKTQTIVQKILEEIRES